MSSTRARARARARARGKPGRTLPRPWQPMQRATGFMPPATAEAARNDPAVAAVIDEIKEIWRNDKYVVIVERTTDTGDVMSLSIRRDDRKPAGDWRDLQRIKNEIAGPEVEAINLHPAESRLVDTANQTWLWCMPPGVTLPLGFNEGRIVSGENDPRFPNTKQRPL
jgi:hypothetical protein